jgi:hypothetical protein
VPDEFRFRALVGSVCERVISRLGDFAIVLNLRNNKLEGIIIADSAPELPMEDWCGLPQRRQIGLSGPTDADRRAIRPFSNGPVNFPKRTTDLQDSIRILERKIARSVAEQKSEPRGHRIAPRSVRGFGAVRKLSSHARGERLPKRYGLYAGENDSNTGTMDGDEVAIRRPS